MVKCERCGRFFFSTNRFQTLRFSDKDFFACPCCIKEIENLKLLTKIDFRDNKIDTFEEYLEVIKFAGLYVDQPSIYDDYIYNLYFTPTRIIGIYLDKSVRSHLSLSAIDTFGLKKRLEEKDQELMKACRTIEHLFSSDERNFDIIYENISEIGIKGIWFKIFLKKPHSMKLIGDAPEFRFWEYSDAYNLKKMTSKFCKIKL
jgi:hypothetical protein